MKNTPGSIRVLLVLGLAGSILVLWFVSAGDQARAGVKGELIVCPSGCVYTSIQTAVDAAIAGDVIKVVQGTYTGIHQRSGVTQVVYIDESVTIQGEYASNEDFYNPPDSWQYPTVIDAQDLGRAIYFSEDVTVTLQGLHIVGGNGMDLVVEAGRSPMQVAEFT